MVNNVIDVVTAVISLQQLAVAEPPCSHPRTPDSLSLGPIRVEEKRRWRGQVERFVLRAAPPCEGGVVEGTLLVLKGPRALRLTRDGTDRREGGARHRTGPAHRLARRRRLRLDLARRSLQAALPRRGRPRQRKKDGVVA